MCFASATYDTTKGNKMRYRPNEGQTCELVIQSDLSTLHERKESLSGGGRKIYAEGVVGDPRNGH